MLNEFLYNLELNKLQTMTKPTHLIKQMNNLTTAYINVPGLHSFEHPLVKDKSVQHILLYGLQINNLNFQIATVYRYALYLATRDRYFELQLNIDKLPRYVLWNVPYIDINKTIQYLRNTHDRKKSC